MYTSERRLMMQEARAEVLQTLRENGLKRGAGTRAGTVALEFEFMQRMSLRAAEALAAGDEDEAVGQLRTQRTFLHDHLLNWLPLLTNDMRLFSRTLFYQGLAQLAMGFAEEDASILAELLDSVEVAA
ncbi:MAG: molecular chaperone [Eggerthella lenta]